MVQVLIFAILYTLIILSAGMHLESWRQKAKQEQKKRSSRVCVMLPKKYDWDL